MRALFVSANYEDSKRPIDDRVEQLRQQGYDVRHLCLKVPRSKPGQSMASRTLTMLPSYLSLVKSALSREKFDLIVTTTSPPFSFVPMVIRGAMRGEEVTIRHWDIFPQTARVAGFGAPKVLLDVLGYMQMATSRLAHKHETLSEPMRQTLAGVLGPDADIEVVPLSPTAGLAPVKQSENRWLKENGLEGKFVVMYAGNLGRMYDFSPLLEAAEELKENDKIAFVFVGWGFQEGVIREAAAGLPNVQLLPRQPEERLSELLCAGDLHVIPLRPGAIEVMWPHKIDALMKLKLTVCTMGFDPQINGVKAVTGAALSKNILDISNLVVGARCHAPVIQ